VEPDRFNTWPLVCSLASDDGLRLEVAPGLRPRLPIPGTQFVDISAPALITLRGRGGLAVGGQIGSLPFADGIFDLVCALDVIEHVNDDDSALQELSRVLKQGGSLLISAPLHASRWTAFDDLVGHMRRYDPAELVVKLARNQLHIERSAVFGMQPRSTYFVDLGMWWLEHHRERAHWWYNQLLMPLGLRFQKPLKLAPGLIALDTVDEILLVCRRNVDSAPGPSGEREAQLAETAD
jgi:SAM-dependent methyltransferase